MITLIKIIVFGLLFIVSGGVFYAWRFRENKALIFMAGILGTIGSIYLFRDLYSSVEKEFEKKFEERVEEKVRKIQAEEMKKGRGNVDQPPIQSPAPPVVETPISQPIPKPVVEEPPPPPTPKVGEVFQDKLKDGSLAPKMVVVPSGSFEMGSNNGYDDEKPVHRVQVESFAIGVYELTVGEFKKFINSTGYKTDAENGKWWCGSNNKDWRSPGFSQEDTHPVVCVSWNDSVAYTKWLSEQTGNEYRLPTEAEWEYAARAGSRTKYWWSDDIGNNKANCYNDYCKDSYEYTSPVGSFSANGFGLYDTVGNVWEWTCSDYELYGSGAEQVCSENTNKNKEVRGGSWNVSSNNSRSAIRVYSSRDSTDDSDGFRILRTY